MIRRKSASSRSDESTRTPGHDKPGGAASTGGHDSPVPSHIVAIGASAGGLEALQQLFSEMPPTSGVSFVVVQHLSPDFKSLMPELLAKQTTMTVLSADHDQALQPNTVYVLAAGLSLTVHGNMLRVQPRPAQGELSLPINLLFESMAGLGARAVVVVLSGTGQDGTVGAGKVHAAGGLVMAQEPSSARFDSMPRAAIESGCVDIVAVPGDMGRALSEWLADPVKGRHFASEVDDSLELSVGAYAPILRQLHNAYDIDFGQYKATTILRRIERRLNASGKPISPEALSGRLADNREELDRLFSDLLIGVTRFFRDGKAFTSVGAKAIKPLVKSLAPPEEMRIWSCGCSTGEEAYSLAIMALEAFEERGLNPRVRVLATDVHGASVQRASAGLYAEEALQDVPADLREKYFTLQPTGLYKVGELLRRSVVFSVHNVLRDAAFPRIDLVSCRNLLIYLQPQAQTRALAAFHFALRPGGFLFLGESESPGELNEAFEVVDQGACIHRKLPGLQLPAPLRRSVGTNLPTRATAALDSRSNVRLFEVLTQQYLPSGLLVNQHDELLHVFGSAGSYLRAAPGRFGSNVFSLLSGPLRTAIMMALRKTSQSVESTSIADVVDEAGDEKTVVRVDVDPVSDRSLPHGYFLVRLTDETTVRPVPQTDAAALPADLHAHQAYADLDAELVRTREALQRTVEDLESANEELQAGNEELMAANEELQSTNEELHAVNEELYTVNAEYELKIKELHETGADLNNLIRATELAIVFLDGEARLRLFTPEASALFPLRPTDIGRELRDFLPRHTDAALFADIDAVLAKPRVIDREVSMSDGRVLRRRVSPYRDSQNKAGGLVLTYVDITDQLKLRETLAEAEAQARMAAIIASVPHLMWTCTPDGTCDYLNPQWVAYTGVPADQQLGEGWLEQVHDEDRDRLTAAWRHSVQTGEMFHTNFRIRRHDGEYRWFDTQGVARRNAHGRIVKWYGSNTDVHDVTVLQRELAENREFNCLMSDSITIGVAYWDRELQNRFSNRAYREWLGKTAEQMANIQLRDAFGPEEFARHERNIQAVLSGEPQKFQVSITSTDGVTSHRQVEYTPHVVRGEVQGFFSNVTDVTGLNEAKSMLDEVFRVSPSAQLVVSAQGRVVRWNPAAEALLGYDGEALDGVGVEDMILPEFRERHRMLRKGYMAHPRRRSMGSGPKIQLVRGDGTLVNMDIDLSPVEWRGQPAVILCLRPTTGVIDSQQAVDEAIRARGAFLAQMSHEIRTPLAAIMGQTELLQLESPNAKQSDRLKQVGEASKHLLSIVDDILDFSRMEAGTVALQSAPFKVAAMVERALDMVADRARTKGLTLHSSIAPEVPERLLGDARRIEQILLNYLTNAVKFTPAGEVTVSVSSTRVSGNRVVLRIEVGDTGIGIAEESLDGLFMPFRQVEQGSARRFGGTGLGLAISRQLARAMNGDCGVRSTVGHGSTFWFTVQLNRTTDPQETGAGERPTSGEEEEVRRACRGKQVLVVDDDNAIRMVMGAIIRKITGMEPVLVENGAAALSRAGESPFDLILMDMQMPEMDGLETTRRLRQMPGLADVPIIALTANVLPEDINQCLTAGMNGHLGKPLVVKQLRQLLLNLFGQKASSLREG